MLERPRVGNYNTSSGGESANWGGGGAERLRDWPGSKHVSFTSLGWPELEECWPWWSGRVRVVVWLNWTIWTMINRVSAAGLNCIQIELTIKYSVHMHPLLYRVSTILMTNCYADNKNALDLFQWCIHNFILFLGKGKDHKIH